MYVAAELALSMFRAENYFSKMLALPLLVLTAIPTYYFQNI